MSLSANYPHQLALMLVALQTDKLPICEHLTDPTEKSLVASLVTYLNNRDFRTPITIARKTLGIQIRVKRSTLFNKLRSLKEKGLIEDITGELPIRFTEKAIAMMQCEWSKQADRWQEGQKNKTPQFKVGRSHFPQSLLPLINRGISENQMRGLMSEAKKAGLKIQEILRHFSEIVNRYEGKTLFLVIRDILRKPTKYSSNPESSTIQKKSTENSLKLPNEMLRTAADNAMYMLRGGEQLRIIDNEWRLISERNGWAPRVPDDGDIAELRERMRQCVLAYAATQGGSIGHPQTHERMPLDGQSPATHALVALPDGRHGQLDWHVLYACLPPAARHDHRRTEPARQQGRQLLRRGIRYLVETIAGGVASLQVLSGPHSGRICSLPVTPVRRSGNQLDQDLTQAARRHNTKATVQNMEAIYPDSVRPR